MGRSMIIPDKDQQEAIDTLSGPLIIVAGAGTGKTSTIMRRIDNLVAHGTSPKRILAITFTKKAAVEMRSRLSARSRGVQTSTIHAWCMRMLHEYYREHGAKVDISIMDDDGRKKWFRQILTSWVNDPDEIMDVLNRPDDAGRFDFAGYFMHRCAAYGYGRPTDPNRRIIRASQRINDPVLDVRERRKLQSARNRMITDLAGKAMTYAGLAYNGNKDAAILLERMGDDLDGAQPGDDGKYAKGTHLMVLMVLAISKYEEVMRRSHAVDFDFILRLTYELLSGDAGVRRGVQGLYDQVFVDEYQDTSKVQADIVNLVAARTGNICVVGDPDQSIYSWRGAAKSTMDRFAKAHPGYKEVHISTNYRSQQAILDAANEVIDDNPQNLIRRHHLHTTQGKELLTPEVYSYRDDAAEGKGITNMLRQRHREGVAYGDMALLMRTHALGANLERWLRMADIPYYVVGALSFFDRKVTKDLVAYMTCLYNPFDDMTLIRVISTPPHGLGPKFLEALRTEQAAHEERLSLYEIMTAMRAPLDGSPGFTGDRKANVDAFLATFEHAFDNGFGVVDILSSMLCDPDGPTNRYGRYGVAYRQWLADSAHSEREATENGQLVDDMFALARQYDETNPSPATDPTSARHSLADFVAGLQTGTPDPMDRATDAVSVMTVHAAKGLEFDTVFLVGVENGIFPFVFHDSSPAKEEEKLQEERRLMYVAMTRAKRRLVITHADRRRTYKGEATYTPSPFIMQHKSVFDFPPPMAHGGRAAADSSPVRVAGPDRGGSPSAASR